MSSATFKVLKFEVVRQLKKPSFWIAILAMPVLICGGLIISIIAGAPTESAPISEDTTIAITDEADILPEDNPFSLYSNKDDGINAVKENKVDLYFFIPADFKDSKKIEFYHVSDGLGLFDESSNAIKSILANYVKSDVSDVEVLALTGNFSIDNNTFASNGEKSNALGKAIIPAIFLVAFFIFVCAFGNRMLMTVVEEKENRVSEMILTSVSSKHLIVGKILALLVLGAIQVLALIIPIIIFIFANGQNEVITSIMNTVVIEPFSLTICILLFLFSILFYAGACTFVGAFTPTAKDASQFFGPIIIGLMLPLYFTQVFLTGEVNGLIEFLTYFPLSAPMALFLRFGVGSISTIGIIIGVAELFILSVIVIRAAVVTFQKNAINFSVALPKFSFKKSAIITLVLLGLSMISGGILLSSNTSAETVTKNASINVPGSCTMTSTGSTSHNAHIVNGIYTPDIGTTTMNVVCNDENGFSIYAVGFTGDEIGATNSTKLVGTAASDYATIDTGTATSTGNPDVSNWAMKLATDPQATYPISIITGYDAYHEVPSAYTKVATRTSNTDSSTGSNLTSTYAVYTSATQAPDTYTGQVKYTLVHPNDAPAPTPPTPITPPESCPTPIPNLTYMQDLNSSNKATVLSSMTEDQQYYLADKRDDKTYCVAKLKDGNIWMLENLRLDLVDSTVQGNLTSDTTNAEDSSLAYLKGTTTYRDPSTDPNGKYPTAALGYGDSSNYFSVPKISVSGTCYNAYCVDSPVSGQWNSEVVTPQTINGVTSIAQGKVGIYYNYCAISAGTYCYGNGTSHDGSPTSDPDPSSLQDVKEDICPKGWRLPTSTTDGEFQALYTAYSSNVTDFQTALDASLSGSFYSGTARGQGNTGYFWSSTWYGTGSMSFLYVTSSNVNPSGYNYRYNVFSARCIAR